MRPKAKAATPNAWRPRFELGVDTVILFSIPVTQVCHDPGEPVVGNAHLNNRGSQRMHRALYNRKDQGYSATQHRGTLARDRLLDSRRHADFPGVISHMPVSGQLRVPYHRSTIIGQLSAGILSLTTNSRFMRSPAHQVTPTCRETDYAPSRLRLRHVADAYGTQASKQSQGLRLRFCETSQVDGANN